MNGAQSDDDYDSTNKDDDDSLFLRPLYEVGLVQNKEISTRHKNLPRASILVLLFPLKKEEEEEEEEWHVLLTQRPYTLKSHAGEVCCPGGKQDPEDEGDDVITALRETMEEVGINRSEIKILSRMETIESVGGLCVTPIVAIWKNPILPSQLVKTINKDEVKAVFYVPLSYFWEEANCIDKRDIEWRGGIFTMRTYNYIDRLEQEEEEETESNNTTEEETRNRFKIWGLTAAVVYEVAKLLMPKSSMNDRKGSLYRWMDEGSSGGKPYWTQRYFTISSSSGGGGGDSSSSCCNKQRVVLHQYDTELKAKVKADTATKKNRLILLPDCKVKAEERGEEEDDGEEEKKYIFSIAILDGRVKWKLAATTKEDRSEWMTALSLVSRNS